MDRINIHDAKTNLSKIIAKVEEGAEVTICRAGKPVAKIIPAAPNSKRLIPGLLKGQVWVADDFNDTPAWLISAFEGDDDGAPR